jgi:hypothetical protein
VIKSKSVPFRESKRLTTPISEGGQGLSQRQAAKVLGVDEGTIRNDLRNNSAENAEKFRIEKPALTIVPPRETFETIVIDPPYKSMLVYWPNLGQAPRLIS